jgi:starvation-inducible outer membrane lipoprotein
MTKAKNLSLTLTLCAFALLLAACSGTPYRTPTAEESRAELAIETKDDVRINNMDAKRPPAPPF